MWVRAVCTAEYTDSKGQTQKVELMHWITELTDQQAGQLMDDEDLAKLEVDQYLATAEEAAKYARINVDTLEQWVENGLLTTEDDGFLKYNLDLFVQSKGNPTAEEKARAGGVGQGTGDDAADDAERSGRRRRGVREGPPDGAVVRGA